MIDIASSEAQEGFVGLQLSFRVPPILSRVTEQHLRILTVITQATPRPLANSKQAVECRQRVTDEMQEKNPYLLWT